MSKPKADNLPYRPCAGVLLFNRDGKIFVGERNDTKGAWQMPQGGIDKGEAPAEAALREMLEEIGTDKAEIVAESEGWIRYDLPPDMVGKVWKGKWRGQEQKWFACRFLGSDADINIETDHPEFGRWQWVELAQLVELIVPFKREAYQQIVDELGPKLSKLPEFQR